METLRLEQKGNYVIVHLDRGKVNAINAQLVAEIRTTFEELTEDSAVEGVVLAGKPHYFSAGLDLIELYQYDETQIREFLIAFGMMHIELALFPKPLVCAITGHCPAGGCVIAVTADHRVMVNDDKYTIGLNEVAVNVQITENLVEAYSFWLGRSLAHKYVLSGYLLPANEAYQTGLVSELAPLDEVIPRAEKQMQHYLHADPDILRNTKAKLRKSWWDQIDPRSEEELEQALAMWWKPEIRAKMKAFIEYLSQRKKA